MALAKEHYPALDRILPTTARNFLWDFPLGRRGIGAVQKIVRSVRALRNPSKRKLWMRQRLLPLRNVVLLNRPLTVSFDGVPVSFVPQGAFAREIWSGIGGKKQEVSFLLNALEPGMIFFDVGANAGLFAISAARKIGGKGVFAFEADASNCELLKRNLRLNCLDHVHMERIAMAESAAREDVRSATMDGFLADNKIPRVDILKVDVKGAELMLFQGAKNLMERADAPLILYEGGGFLTRRFGYHPVEILWFLEACGYAFFLLNGETGKISELKPDYGYDSLVVAAKPGWRAGLRE